MYHKAKYSKQFNNELLEKVLAILMHEKEAISLNFLASCIGGDITTQKLARVLSVANEFTPLIKEKGKDGCMRYKLREKHIEQGYDISRFEAKNKLTISTTIKENSWPKPRSEGWISPRFRYLYEEDLKEGC